MSDTPETNALIESCDQHKPHTNFGEALKLARSLERRLQEAQAELESARTALFSEGARSGAAKAERDTALREVEEHKSRCTVLEAEVAEWKSQFAAALAEKGKP